MRDHHIMNIVGLCDLARRIPAQIATLESALGSMPPDTHANVAKEFIPLVTQYVSSLRQGDYSHAEAVKKRIDAYVMSSIIDDVPADVIFEPDELGIYKPTYLQ